MEQHHQTDHEETAMTRFQYRHQYDDDADAIARASTDIKCEDESKTMQHFAQDADLNEIVRRYGITDGAIPAPADDPRFYGDFSAYEGLDLGEALRVTNDAQQRFNALPADVRKRFANDPAELWRFVNDPSNDVEAVRLGLLKRQETEAPPPKPPTPPTE